MAVCAADSDVRIKNSDVRTFGRSDDNGKILAGNFLLFFRVTYDAEIKDWIKRHLHRRGDVRRRCTEVQSGPRQEAP